MGEIRKDNLHESLIKYMQTLGLTEEQIKEYIENELELDGLQTESKDLVGSINELFQNVDNGKQLIADAIDDESITKDSTFEAMSNAITNTQVDKTKWYELLKTAGYDIQPTCTMDDLFTILSNSSVAVTDIKEVYSGGSFTFILKK